MNGVAVARAGLILNQDGATGSRKVSGYLPDLWEAITNSKSAAKVQTNSTTYLFLVFFVYL